MDLYRFADKFRYKRLGNFAQDILIGLLNERVWVDLLVFGEENNASLLKEAATQFGIRCISPFVFMKFYNKKQKALDRKKRETSVLEALNDTTPADSNSSAPTKRSPSKERSRSVSPNKPSPNKRVEVWFILL